MLENGLPFVRIDKGELYEVRVVNNSPEEVAVTLAIDGIDQFTFSDVIVEKALESLQVLDFAYCAEDPSAISAATSKCSASAANPDLTENSTADTALSLDGKGSTGQSVGQHVCTG